MINILLLLLLLVTSNLSADEQVLVRSDMRMSPTYTPFVNAYEPEGTVKRVAFTFYTGNLFTANPGAHGWVIADGIMLGADPVPLRGRGITFGNTMACDGVGFEHFAPPNNYFPAPCYEMEFKPYSFYDFEICVDEAGVSFSVDGITTHSYDFPDDDVVGFNTVAGVAGDHKPSIHGFFNVAHELGCCDCRG